MKNPYLTRSHDIDSLSCEAKLWLRWHECLSQLAADLAEFFARLSLESALEGYAAKRRYSKFGHCDCFDSATAVKPENWAGATGPWIHALIARQVLGQIDAMCHPGAKTEPEFSMGGLGVASYANVSEGVFV